MSIQGKLLKLIISVVTIATFFAALHGYRNSQSHIDAMFDQELVTMARFIAANTSFKPVSSGDSSSFVYQIFDAKGQLLAKSSSAPDAAISDLDNGFTTRSFYGARWRVYVLSNADKKVLLAQSMQERRSSADDILLVTITPIVLSIPLIGLLIFYVVRKSLKPLRQLSNQLRNKSSEDLSAVNIDNPSKELEPVLTRLNKVFKQLNYAFELEKQVSANAAHELRTPISVLSITANNLNTAFKEDNITQSQLDELSQGVDRMAHVIEQIIHLFRFTHENFAKQLSIVNLEKVLQEVITNNYSSIETANQSIELHASALSTQGDPFALYVLFENILRNAIKYAGDGAQISISLYAKDASLMIDFDDSGKGLCEQERNKLTQRFYRSTNQTDIKGSGLGLAIAKHIISLHGASMHFDQSPTGGLRVSLALKQTESSNHAL